MIKQTPTSRSMSLTDVKKELKRLEKDKLIDLITDLYKKNKSVREYFDFFVNPDEQELYFKYKDKIFYAFYPLRGNTLKIRQAKQALTDFKKHGVSAELNADLLLFYVQTGVDFTNDFGDIDEAFYNSIGSVYVQALKFMRTENLLELFAGRAKKIVSDTYGIGWGFHDYLAEVYFNFYPDDLEESENTQEPTKGRIIKLGRPRHK
jgi:hypothetical protein